MTMDRSSRILCDFIMSFVYLEFNIFAKYLLMKSGANFGSIAVKYLSMKIYLTSNHRIFPFLPFDQKLFRRRVVCFFVSAYI